MVSIDTIVDTIIPMPDRRPAPASIREQIAQSLKAGRYRVYPDGQRYLDYHGLNTRSVVADLAQEIERFEIFELPIQGPGAKRKYDYVIRYDDPDLLVYAKMTPVGEPPPMVFLTFHNHNIPGPPLPRIPIEPQS